MPSRSGSPTPRTPQSVKSGGSAGGNANSKAGSIHPLSSPLGSSPTGRRHGPFSDASGSARSREETFDLGSLRLDTIDERRSAQTTHATASPVRKRVNAASNKLFRDHPSCSGSGSGSGSTSIGKLKEQHGESQRSPDLEDGSVRPADGASTRPPSFVESQFATIIRRQRKRRVFSPAQILNGTELGDDVYDVEANRSGPAGFATEEGEIRAEGSGSDLDSSSLSDRKGLQLKMGGGASAFPVDRADPLMTADNAWQFAGWGSISLMELSPSPPFGAPSPPHPDQSGATPGNEAGSRPRAPLGQWRAAAIAGNAVTGSVFYALPAVIATASVLSPISILVACLLLYPFRPIICELASALSASNAGNYSYFSNVTSKTISLLAAAITMLDAIATAAVSSGTASAYISGQARSSNGTASSVLDEKAISILLLVGLAALCLSGLRDSSTLALIMFLFHVASMVALIIAGSVAWARQGNDTLVANWHQGIDALTATGTGKGLARAVFDGVCIAFVGLTGFECSPSYINSVRPGQFPKALRNLHVIVIAIEAMLMLLVLANLPLDEATASANVLALLGQASAEGSWLKLFIVVDACLVLCGGIITGAIAFSGLTESLCDDFVLPRFFGLTLPKTGAPYASLALFLALSIIMSVTSSFNLTTLSSVFSVSFLCVMTLFGVALLVLKCVRPTLPRSPISGLATVFAGIAIGIIAMAGNFALSPIIIEQTLLYFLVLAVILLVFANRVRLATALLWLIDNSVWTHRLAPSPHGLSKRLIRWIRHEKRSPVIYFTKTDDISTLTQALYYIKQNEQTSICKLVHCYRSIDEIPDQLDETFQLVDEIFPAITVDLVFVEAPFTPGVVEAVTRKLGVPRSRAFISCPSGKGETIGTRLPLADFGGLRIVLP